MADGVSFFLGFGGKFLVVTLVVDFVIIIGFLG